VPIIWKFWSLNLLELQGPAQASKGKALPLLIKQTIPTDFGKKLKYQISSTSVQWEQSFSMPTDGWTDRHDKTNSLFSQFCERV
jgi:hypothetical protein